MMMMMMSSFLLTIFILLFNLCVFLYLSSHEIRKVLYAYILLMPVILYFIISKIESMNLNQWYTDSILIIIFSFMYSILAILFNFIRHGDHFRKQKNEYGEDLVGFMNIRNMVIIYLLPIFITAIQLILIWGDISISETLAL